MIKSGLAEEMIELGKILARREFLLNLVRLRFPAALTPDVEQAIVGESNLALLRFWDNAAMHATTAAQFLAILHRLPPQ